MLRASLIALFLIACAPPPSDPNQIGGDTNVPLGQIGNRVSTLGNVTIGNTSTPVNASMTLLSNSGGVATFRVQIDISSIPALQPYYDKLPTAVKSAGRIDTNVQFKVTSEGIQDFFNSDRAPHTLVKYDAQVGDQYVLNKSNGQKITRTVVARSDQDDFPYGFYSIKTITVEQDSRIPGIKKFRYRANHRFGIVYFELVADDGSTMSTLLSASNT